MVDLLGADIAGRARAVLDDHGLPPFARQPVGDNSRSRVGRSSRRKWSDDFDGMVRVVAGQRRRVALRKEGQKQRQYRKHTASGRRRWRKSVHSKTLPLPLYL